MANKLELVVEAEVKKALQELNKVDGSLNSMKNSTNKSSSALGGMKKTFMATAAKFAAGVGTFMAVKSAITSVTEAYLEQEQAEKLLENAVERNPLMDTTAAQRIKDFTSELQSFTTVGDEVSIKLASIAVNSGRTENETKKMVLAAADASEALGIDMERAMMGLNQSMEGQVGVLGRYIPELRNLTKEQLEAGGAVDYVRQNFRGAAEAMADTAGGSMERLSNAVGDYKEALGSSIAEGLKPFNSWLTRVVENATIAQNEINDIRDALDSVEDGTADSSHIDDLRQRIQNLNEEIEITEQRMSEVENRGGGNTDAIEATLEAKREEVVQHERTIQLLAQQARYNEMNRRGNEAAAEQQEIINGYNESFLSFSEDITDAYRERQHPLELEIETWERKLDAAVQYRDEMREQGIWEDEHQETINGLVAELERTRAEYNDLLDDGSDDLEDEEESLRRQNEYNQKKLELEQEIANARYEAMNSSGAEQDFYKQQLSDLQNQYDQLTLTTSELENQQNLMEDLDTAPLSDYEKGVAKIVKAWEEAEQTVDQFGGAIDGLKSTYNAWTALQDNQMAHFEQSMNEQIEKAREAKEEQLEIINEEYDEKLTALQENLENDAISREEYNARKAEIDEQKRQQEEEAAAEQLALEKKLLKEQNKLAKKQFDLDKAAAIANATINGAAATVKALTAGPILGPIMAATIAGLTAAEIAMISQTEFVPKLAEGGIVNKPTFAEIGEGGEPEMVLPLSKAKSMGFGDEEKQGVIINFNGPVFGIDDLNRKIFEGIEKAQKNSKLPNWSYAA